MAAPKGNKYAVGNSGRPKKFSSKEEMEAVIDAYFAECDRKGDPYTVEGLAVALDISRNTLLTYEKMPDHEEFNDTVKRAKMKVQSNMVTRGLKGAGNPTLTIFLLKNNHGYEDRSVSEIKEERLIKGMTKDQVAEVLSDEEDVE